MKCPDIEHDYFKFDEATVVCRKCGDQRVVDLAKLIEKLPQPIYLPCPGPHYPMQPWYPYPWTVITSGGTWPPPNTDTQIMVWS